MYTYFHTQRLCVHTQKRKIQGCANLQTYTHMDLDVRYT